MGQECFKVITDVKTICSFWTDCYNEIIYTKLPVTIFECKRLVFHKKTPNDTDIQDLTYGHYGKNIKSPPIDPNGRSQKQQYTNYYYTTIDLIIMTI